MPLILAPAGRAVKVIRIVAEGDVRRHLENLGILVGAALERMEGGGGVIIVKVKDARLALDRGLAAKILVS